MMTRALILTVLFTTVPLCSYAQIVDPQNVLIENVHIIEAGSDEESPLVSILIRDNKLEIISKEQIPVPDNIIAVDGEGGYVLGALRLEETPSFIILRRDPRVDFDMLLDTDSNAIFAVHNGRLRKNSLLESLSEITLTKKTARSRGWMAYNPPPLALPTTYLDKTKWNRWDTKYVSGLFVSALALDRQFWPSQNSDSQEQVGSLSLFEGGDIRAFRVGAVGTINLRKPWVYTIFGATNAFDKGFEVKQKDEFTLFDYRLDIPVFETMNLSVGKQKEPISMERLMSMTQLPMQERTSVSDSMLPSRNLGVVLSSTAFGQRATWAGGIFNNFIDSSSSIGSTATQFVGRGTWLPFLSEDESHLIHLGAGVRLSNAKNGIQYLTEPEFNKSPDFVDTGEIAADSATLYNLEASWRYGPYWVAAEYIDSTVDSISEGGLNFNGYHLTGSWIWSGEMRSYNKKSGILGPIPVARTVNQGGWGAWELALRYSSLDLSDKSIDGGKMDIFSLGVNWWLTPTFNVNINYRLIDNEKDGLNGETTGFMGRVLLVLE